MDADEIRELYTQSQTYENLVIPAGEMSPRERFMNIMDFKKVDRIIDCEFGYWNETLRRWHKEGLPEYVKNNDIADIYFGFDVWRKHVPAQSGIFPMFEHELISDDGRHQIIYNHEHVKCEIFSDGKDSIPHYIDFPIKDVASYRTLFKERLKPQLEKRIKINLKEAGEKVKNRNYVLDIHAGSTAGKIRDWMGFENICMAIYDQPELLQEILKDLEDLMVTVATAVTEHMAPDLVAWWEDIAFKNGPIVTPDFFINQCGPVIKKVMDIYKKAGCKYSYVDCDGDFSRLMPGWLNNGVNIMFPLEVASGIHPEKLRRENPGIRMM
ncbi:MAG: hypothetical protein JNL74_14435, partial [Fibrobacteres bacterium]|nr:hypothetical protein [Fibrobacterota bacterium]